MAEDFYALTKAEKALFDKMADWFAARSETLSPQARGALGTPVPMHLGKAKERILTTGDTATGKVNLWEVSTAGAEVAATGSTENANDWFGTGASSGEKVVMQRHRQSGRLYLHAWPTQRCVGRLNGSLSTTSVAQNVDGIKPLWGANPTTSTGATLSVSNPLKFSAADNAACRFERNRDSSAWEFYGVEGMSAASTPYTTSQRTVQVDFRITTGSSHKFQKKTEVIRAVAVSTSTGWIDVHIGTTCT